MRLTRALIAALVALAVAAVLPVAAGAAVSPDLDAHLEDCAACRARPSSSSTSSATRTPSLSTTTMMLLTCSKSKRGTSKTFSRSITGMYSSHGFHKVGIPLLDHHATIHRLDKRLDLLHRQRIREAQFQYRCVPHRFPVNPHNAAYLKTKAARGGHLF